MSRVLLTGASGFIGAPCLRLLSDAGLEVHAVALGDAPTGLAEAACWHDVDLLDPVQVHELLVKVAPTHLLHLAWFVAPGEYWTSAENLRWVSAGLDLVREFADAGGQRAVMVGTCAEYEQSDAPLVEGVTPLRPTTLYGAAKSALHLAAHAYFAQRDVSFAWAHLFYLYGPGEYPGRLVPSVIRALLQGHPFECAHPDDVRDFLYVDDVAGALVALLVSNVDGDVNIGSGQPTQVGDLVHAFAVEMGQTDLVTCPDTQNAASFAVADNSRLVHEVRWRPDWARQTAVKATIDWWRQHGPTGGKRRHDCSESELD
jgi:nucleoside-diphosphate-sugar epimerase